MKKPYQMHVISHSHWDREWRYGFAETRLYLVEMMDRMLEVLDNNPDYKYFHLDGQTILLEDYLAVKPEMEDKLKNYIEQGRILVGPWYTLPEEFMATGESLVRNLLLGHKIAERFGKVMKVGYTPTSCGQISQLPQIYGGFDVEGIFFYRGLNPEDAKAEFTWESPDGTQALAFHFYSWTRSNFFSVILYPTLFDGWRDLSLEDVKETFHLTDQPYSYVHDSTDRFEDCKLDNVSPGLKKVKKDAISKATTNQLLYMDGCDNGSAMPLTIRIIDEANRLSKSDKYFHSNLPNYVRAVKKAAKRLQVLKGEMRNPGITSSNGVYAGVLSARMYLKPMNMRAEYNLAGRAEPWATIAWLLGREYPSGQLEKAWKYLFANHAHDSIGSCSTDRVHDDMEYRYTQCSEMAQWLYRRSLEKIASKMPPAENNEFSLIVFNSLPHDRSEIVSADIDLPAQKEINVVQYNPSGSIREWNEEVRPEDQITEFALFDGQKEIPYEIASKEKRNILVERLEIMTHQFSANRSKINFAADNIPALGYKVFRVVPGPRTSAKKSRIAKSARILENEYLKVRINNNGSLTVDDKLNGRTYKKLHIFEDLGDVGDTLTHTPPEKDQRITSSAGKAAISLEYADSFKATVRVNVKMTLPAEASANMKSRSLTKKALRISSLITLCKDSKRLDIVTEFDNQVKDHRLRVLFPAEIKAKFSNAASAFDVVRRPMKTPYLKNYFEKYISTYPNHGFVDLSDGKVGLAILNEGMTEYEVLDDDKKTLALTLVRSTEKVCGTNASDNIGQQCLRKFKLRYSIYPHVGDYQAGEVFAQSRQFNLPLAGAQNARRGGAFGDEVSFFKLAPASLVLSALKQAENGKSIIVRFFNPTLKKFQAKVSCFADIKKAWETNMNEQRLRELKPSAKRNVSIGIKPKKVITLEIKLNGK